METTVVFEEKVAVTPSDLNKLRSKSLDEILLSRFANVNEGKCSVHGWVIPGSLKIISRSMAQIEGGRFTGDLVSWVQVEASVIYPVDGARLKAMVLKKNKMGLFVMYQDAIQIMVPRDLHIGNEEFEAVQIGDTVEVELKKSRFQVRDMHILSVGLFITKVANAVRANELLAAPNDTSEEDLEVESEPEPEVKEEAVKDSDSSATDEEDEEDEAVASLLIGSNDE